MSWNENCIFQGNYDILQKPEDSRSCSGSGDAVETAEVSILPDSEGQRLQLLGLLFYVSQLPWKFCQN